MAKIERIERCRKEQKCGKCGKPILVGSPYLKSTPFRQRPIIRCTECGLRSWETSGSNFVQTCGRISEDWEKDYGLDDGVVESIKSDLEELKDECECSYDNMPEGLQQGDTGCLLEERIDMLDSVIDELDSISEWEDIMEESKEEYLKENELEEEDLSTDDENEIVHLAEDKLRDEIDSALSNLEF